MATHPVEHDVPKEPEPGEAANPTRLPVEPEFGDMLPAGEPEDPEPKQPPI
jgi:hypothetical protein